MYIVTNALRNVMRNRGRNALIGAIILAVIVTSVVALMISNTASGIIEDYKGRFGAEVRLQPNMEKVRAEAMANSKDGRVMITVPSIPPEQYIAFGESDQLQSSRFMASTGVNSESMTVVDEELGRGNGMMMMGGPGMAGNNANAPMSFMMSLWGNKLTEFEDGTRELAEGKLPEQMNEAMISTELAETSGIAVGDKLSLYGELSNMPEGKREGTSYELTVVGTYYDATEPYADGAARNAYTNRRNEILTTYETVIQQLKPEMNGIRIEATYYLKEPGLLEAFAAEVYAKGLSETFDVTTDEASYNKIVGPVEGLKGIAVTFMIVVLIFGGIIIALLSSIAIRERKYEIGVLRAMGMKKWKVAFGLWSETLMITCLCLAIGLGSGTLVAQPITDALLADQIEAAQASASQQGQMGGMMLRPPGTMTAAEAEPLSQLDITLGLDTTLQMIGIALLLASLAGLISISRITKYEPINILMERN